MSEQIGQVGQSTLRLLAFLVVIAAAIFATYAINNRAIERERKAQIVACERVQILRDQANSTSFLIYETFRDVREAQREALRVATTQQEREVAKRSLERANRVVNTTVLTGPINCFSAVDEPDTYQPPAPIFIKKGGMRVELLHKRTYRLIERARTGEKLPPFGKLADREG